MTENGATNPDNLQVDVCVCTFRRKHVAETLRSLSRLTLKPGWTIRVIVADNDDTPSARALVEATARECSLAVTYLHAPARNISVARNACLDAATAPFLAFIDDDETAVPAWLNALLNTVKSSDAAVVLGWVQAVYGPECPVWMRKGDFHSIKPVWAGGKIVTGYTCNVLLRRDSFAFQGLRFRPEFGRSGGEDTVFFAAVHKAGGRFAYAPEAIVKEPVTAERARFLWLLKRYFRSGQTHGVLLLEDVGAEWPVRLKNAAVAAVKTLYCLMASLFNMTRDDRMRYWVLRGAMHAGVVCRLLGKRELEQYG